MAQVMQRGSSQPKLNTSSGSMMMGGAAHTSIGSGVASQSTTALNKSKRFGVGGTNQQQTTSSVVKQQTTTSYYQMSGGEAHKTTTAT